MSVNECPRRLRRRPVLAALLMVAVAAGGCGGDDEDEAAEGTSTSGAPPSRTVTVPPARTVPQEERTETTSTSEGGSETTSTSPEDGPGGAGDEEAARSQVVLTGNAGRIGPVLVKVPPFIAIRVVLRSGDGKPYVLRLGRKVIRAGAIKGSPASAELEGLRPGKRLVGSSVAGKVVIEASAEPGP